MFRLLGFHWKRILKSGFYWMGYALILVSFLSMMFIMRHNDFVFMNYVIEFDLYQYVEVVIMAVIFCMAIYLMRQESELESICFFSPATILVSKMLAILLSSLLLLCIPLAFGILRSLMESTGAMFNFYAYFYMVIRWCNIILSTHAMAFFFAYFIRSAFTYVLAVPVTILCTFLNEYFFSKVPFLRGENHIVESFLSMQKPFVRGIDLDYTGARLDAYFLSKFAYVLIGLVLVILFLWFLKTKFKRAALFFVMVTLFLEVGSVVLWTRLHPVSYHTVQKLYTAGEGVTATVSSYSGEIHLGEKMRVDCQMELTPLSEEVILRLDKAFVVEECLVNGSDHYFRREGDYLILNVGEDRERMTLDVSYHGRIYYISDLSSLNIFSTRLSSALPARFAFLPLSDGDLSKKHYNLILHSHNTLISNLEIREVGKGVYAAQGEAVTCSIFSGYLTQYEKDGTIIYRMKYDQIKDYDGLYEEFMRTEVLNALTAEHEAPPSSAPRKLFIIYGNYGVYGYGILYDDYAIYDVGTPEDIRK
ncbi:MAG: hypothetical protein Q4Q17_04105 [Tissierellia bacterium]|nr:hypothetical protein [Tissierellia bacterium]